MWAAYKNYLLKCTNQTGVGSLINCQMPDACVVFGERDFPCTLMANLIGTSHDHVISEKGSPTESTGVVSLLHGELTPKPPLSLLLLSCSLDSSTGYTQSFL